MSDRTTTDFIEKELLELSEKYQIPTDIIPQLIGLLKTYPDIDSSIQGAKKGLRDGLEQQIENIKNQGRLD